MLSFLVLCLSLFASELSRSPSTKRPALCALLALVVPAGFFVEGGVAPSCITASTCGQFPAMSYLCNLNGACADNTIMAKTSVII